MVDVFDLSNADPFRTKTKFDVEKFKGLETRVKFCWVPWDDQNVIDWKSEEQRNAYFDELEGHVLDTKTGWNFKNLEVWKANLGKHAGDIAVPFPYAESLQYNYVWIELYEVPVAGGGSERREHYGYRLVGLSSKAGSTTSINIELDTWTTYWPSVKVGGINLERGHYYHAVNDAASFLENPLENSLGLTEPEPDLPDLKPKVAHTKLVSFAKSEPRICVATTGDFGDRRSWFTVIPSTSGDNPDARGVAFPAATTPGSMGAAWNTAFDDDRGDYNDAAVSGMKASVKQPANGSGSPEALNIYSMTPSEYLKFVAYARQDMVQILDSVKGVYVLDAQLINEGQEFTQWGFKFKKVAQSADPKLIDSFKPTQAMFAYPAIARNFAKLYTRQFATIEISNMQGGRAEISVEEIAETIDVYARSSSLFPYLKLEALLDGIGGRGIKKYAVRPLGNMEASSFGGRWEDYKFDLDIPLMAITVAKDQEVAQHDFVKREQAARKAKVDQVYKKYSADQSWTAARVGIDASFTNAQAVTEQARINDGDKVKNEYDIKMLDATNSRDIALATTLKDYNNATAEISNRYDNGQLENQKDYSNAQRSTTLALDNAGISANNINVNAVLGAETDRTNTLAELQNTYDHWIDVAKPTEAERINGSPRNNDWNLGQGLRGDMINRFEGVWNSKSNLFQTLTTAATSTAAMGIMTSSQIAALGAIGAGISSLPGPSITSTYEAGETSVGDGAASVTSGAFAGIASMNPINMAFTLGISEKIWELTKKQVNIQYAYEADEFMELNGTSAYYRGRGTKWAEYEHNYYVSQWDNTLAINSVWRDWGAGQIVRDDLESRAYNVGTANTERSYQTAVDIGGNNAGVVSTTAQNSYEVDTQNITADYDTRLTVLGNDQSVSSLVQQANFDQANLNTGANFDTAGQIALMSLNLSNTIIGRVYRNSTLMNGRTAEAQIWGIDTTLELANLGADTELGKAKGDWNADLLTAVQGAPTQIGEASGAGWIDQWGLRGLEIRVRRCSDAVAQQAASTFMLFGYRAPRLFVQDPKISMMSKFTYWKGSIWLEAELINESNKQIFRNMFQDGVTVWNDPSLIFTDISTNTPIEEAA